MTFEIILLLGGLIILVLIANKFNNKESVLTPKTVRCDLIKEPHKWVYKTDDKGENPFMICSKCNIFPETATDSEGQY